jgi:hypothetical protein
MGTIEARSPKRRLPDCGYTGVSVEDGTMAHQPALSYVFYIAATPEKV